MALLSGLRHFTNTELILGFRTLGNNAVLELASGLLALRNTNLYELSQSTVSLDSATSLSHALQYLTKLHPLDLSKNNIGPKVTSSLAMAFKYITNLEYLITTLVLMEPLIWPKNSPTLLTFGFYNCHTII